uniref:GRAS9 n=1 Tax=Tamarix hispida TaxID=189793 RepID=A0A2S1WLV5_9CARY|nr:GRAS9 [Tamarix hispida]
MSTAAYRNPKLYALKGGKDGSGLSSHQLYGPDNHKMMYVAETYSSQSYDPNYFLDSPSEELIHPSSSDDQWQGVASCQPRTAYETKFDSECVLSQSAADTNEYDEVTMRLKLQELEHALLDDDEEDDGGVLGPYHCMDLDGAWAGESIQKSTVLHGSPKESTSSDSNLSSVSSSMKEVCLPSPRTLKDVLFNCAAAISEGNIEAAATMINDLRHMVSIQGDPSQRIAAYMVEGLAARLASSGKFLYKALKCKEPPSLDRLAAMQILFEVCPCFKFGFMAANGSIMEASRNENRVHIIDFDISQGSQYISLIQSLANQSHKPRLRLTGVDDPDSVQRPIGGLKLIGQRLEKLAEALEVPFKFQAVAENICNVTPAMLGCKGGEALVVNFAFQLHHMPDESVSTVNQRDRLLRMVKSLRPKLVTIVEQDVNTNTAPFLTRFGEAYSYYSAVFASLDAALARESQDRVNVEKQCLARDIVNIIACEGEERIERYEVAGKWRARMAMAGFSSCPISQNVTNAIDHLMSGYCSRYKLKQEMGALHFGWEDKNLIVASAWR